MRWHNCTQLNLWQEMVDCHGLDCWLFMFSRGRCLPIAVMQWNECKKTTKHIYNIILPRLILSVSDGCFTTCPLLWFLHRRHCLCKKQGTGLDLEEYMLPACPPILCAGWKPASHPALKCSVPPITGKETFLLGYAGLGGLLHGLIWTKTMITSLDRKVNSLPSKRGNNQSQRGH